MLMNSAHGDSVVLRWSRHPRCVGLARWELRKALAGWGLAPLEEAAVLVLSELLTNAGRHARVSPGREIETWYLRLSDTLLIEVHDTSSDWPEIREPDLESPGGRGLTLVAALADSWGVKDRNGPGKAVWAELSLHH
ncbi:Histidine kinase-, DNA gyrase B-, and HSP90-like ATPase [Streptomyces sp. S4.7]|uniref:ATP-binding protein n=1 Tax=Streptomyces sp. S4.7 TaxID=2705439 RepID=UPI0013975CE4|nr:ATP-binding protein [Streptomyces sp. S4.7]QHY97731.1 Histidine kinase-, DNA gyrase B-, and HSP90-like ATPase [Streptomyces sp. S4.7]